MAESRRLFLKTVGVSLVGAGASVPFATALARGTKEPAAPATGRRWAMVVDTRKCLQHEGCTACFDACHAAHNVPKIENPRHEVKWIWKAGYEHAFPEQAHEFTEQRLHGQQVPVLCNHCERPPCVKVCPTQSTWKRASDGIVMMDMHRCIGCRYCIVACPYGSRSFNFTDPRPFIEGIHDNFPSRTRGVVEKCNFCAERLAEGGEPACVAACRRHGGRALTFGDLNEPGSSVLALLKSRHTIRRKPNLGTGPNVFYIV
jgi:Fe-S-cluster-containing dehydrogenase component